MRHDGDYDDNVRAFRRVLDSTSPQRSADFEGLDVGALTWTVCAQGRRLCQCRGRREHPYHNALDAVTPPGTAGVGILLFPSVARSPPALHATVF